MSPQRLDELIATHRDRPGALLPLLHAVQDEAGHIPTTAVPVIAQALNLSRAEVHGVATYYHHFRTEPAGRHVLQVCRAESCQSRGGEALWAHACASLGCDADGHGGHATSADGAWTLEPVYCLGLCAQSPAIQLDQRLHARMSVAKLDRVTQAVEARDAEQGIVRLKNPEVQA
ncbi:MAG: formate dehydrogenase subunit gamma [Leptothrix sp. (in: b-proteobacteria)]